MLTAFTTKDAMQCSSKEVAHTTKCNLAVDKSACMIFCQKQYVRGFEGSRKVERQLVHWDKRIMGKFVQGSFIQSYGEFSEEAKCKGDTIYYNQEFSC